MAGKKFDIGSKSLESVLSDLRKDGTQIGAFAGFDLKVEGLSTGNITLDALTGIGGVPKGRITEFIGMPSSAKTTAALQTAAQVQQSGGRIFYADYERTLDPDYCEALGLDIYDESFLYLHPQHLEEGANAFRALVASGEITLGVFDSVASMVTQDELESPTGAVQVGTRAKMMHQMCRQLNPLLPRFDTSALFINHVMDEIPTNFMARQLAAQGIKKKTSPGGRALPFYASLRVEFAQSTKIRSEQEDVLTGEKSKQVTGIDIEATVIKNKAGGVPFRKGKMRVRTGKGLSQEFSVLTLLTVHGVIKKGAGGWFTFPPELRLNHDDDNVKIQSEEKVLSLMEDNPEWRGTLTTRAYDLLRSLEGEAFEEVDPSEHDTGEESA
jgi:recombination protein RecA